MSFEIDIQQIQKLENLELIAKQVVEGFITGLHKSPFHGFSVEFAEHRLYNTGESTKHVDWKLFGRTDKLFVKRYEEETNLRCQLVIDASPPGSGKTYTSAMIAKLMKCKILLLGPRSNLKYCIDVFSKFDIEFDVVNYELLLAYIWC